MVSVIIPIRKGENVSEVINSLKLSCYKDIEIIVVDEGLERSAQRNIGIKRAKGEYLISPSLNRRRGLFMGFLVAQGVWFLNSVDA